MSDYAEKSMVEIAEDMGQSWQHAWRNAEWTGEYYDVPHDSRWRRSYERVCGLIDGYVDDAAVTPKGETFIAWLNRPPRWKRALRAIGDRLYSFRRLRP